MAQKPPSTSFAKNNKDAMEQNSFGVQAWTVFKNTFSGNKLFAYGAIGAAGASLSGLASTGGVQALIGTAIIGGSLALAVAATRLAVFGASTLKQKILSKNESKTSFSASNLLPQTNPKPVAQVAPATSPRQP